MKFYKNINYKFIYENVLTAIYICPYYIAFYKNGKLHNTKNSAHINGIFNSYYLNNEFYGDNNDFTKESWRRFCKLKAFL
jgi:hypothetical protein